MKQTFEIFIKTLCRKWEEETLPKWSFIYKQLEKWQNECYTDNLDWVRFCRLTFLYVLMRESVTILKIANIWRKNLVIFQDVKKLKCIFLIAHLFLIFVNKESFFSRIYRDGIKKLFHDIWRNFRTAKIKHSNSNL